MNKRLILSGGTILFILAGFATAATLSFPEHNFAVEIPVGWTKTDVAAPALAAVKNEDGQKIFLIIAARVPDNERDTVVHSMASAAKDASKAKGWKISSERQVVVSGITFDSYIAQVPGGTTLISWMTSAGSEAYSLQGIHKAGDASSDAEIRSILNSFHLLSAAPANMPSYDKSSAAYRIGRTFGGPCICLFLVGLLVVAGLGIFWLIRRKKTQP